MKLETGLTSKFTLKFLYFSLYLFDFNLKSNLYKIIYTTPETMNSQKEFLKTLQIGLIAIDECHLIIDWVSILLL